MCHQILHSHLSTMFEWKLSTMTFFLCVTWFKLLYFISKLSVPKISCNDSVVHACQMYYSLWRRLLKLFWWLVVAYTMLVLISIYTYQFEDFPGYWRNFTGFTEEQYVLLQKLDNIQYSPTPWYYAYSFCFSPFQKNWFCCHYKFMISILWKSL